MLERKTINDSVIKRLKKIAFGKSNDIVKLAFLEKENCIDEIDNLDLTLLSEVKRGVNGNLEVKLINRIEAIRLMLSIAGPEQKDSGETAYHFIEAISEAAEKNKSE